jgi:hypothetical protein
MIFELLVTRTYLFSLSTLEVVLHVGDEPLEARRVEAMGLLEAYFSDLGQQAFDESLLLLLLLLP